MKKIFATTLICFLIPFSFFIIGCCKNQNFKITGTYRFIAYDPKTYEDIEIIRRNKFELHFYPKIDFIGQKSPFNTNCVYATTCERYMKNCIKAGTVKLTLDKEVKLLSKTVPPNLNLIDELNLEYMAFNTDCKEVANFNGQVVIKFSEDLMKVIEIENGIAKFNISYETNDGKIIEAGKEVSIYLK